MNLPFGLPAGKETGLRRREDSSEAAVLYERKLAEYRDILETYRRYIKEYSIRLEGYERRFKEQQINNVQAALDLTYLKEQGDRNFELLHLLKAQSGNKGITGLEALTGAIGKTDGKLETLDQEVRSLEDSLNNLGKSMLGMAISMDNMDKGMNTLNTNVEGLDKNVVNRLSEFLLELQKQHIHQNRQIQTEVLEEVEKLKQSAKKGKSLLWFILIFNFFGLFALILMVLYYLEIIPI